MTTSKGTGSKRRKKAEVTRPPEQFLELAELLDYVGQVIARGVPGAVWVRAEIAALTEAADVPPKGTPPRHGWLFAPQGLSV